MSADVSSPPTSQILEEGKAFELGKLVISFESIRCCLCGACACLDYEAAAAAAAAAAPAAHDRPTSLIAYLTAFRSARPPTLFPFRLRYVLS